MKARFQGPQQPYRRPYCEPQSGNKGSTWDNEDPIISLDQSDQSDLKPGVPVVSGARALEAVEGELHVRRCVVHNVIPPL